MTEAFRLDADQRQILSTPLTAMFMHAGWMHLIGNMWFLMIFGDNIEDRLGHFPYLCFYLVGGLLATLGQYLQDPTSQIPMVGASGAIAAVSGSLRRHVSTCSSAPLIILIVFFTIWDLPALAVLGYWFFLQSLAAHRHRPRESAAASPSSANVSGFVAGMVIMPLLSAFLSPPQTRRCRRTLRCRMVRLMQPRRT